MFGYQQTAYNYPAYASANGQQTANLVGYQQQTGSTATGTAAAMTQMGNAANAYTYDTSQYSLAASAYAHYSQAAQQQTANSAGNYSVQPSSTDYTATINSGAYGVIGGGKPTTGAKTGAGTGANAVTAHYAGYEAAVYAAASNYIQNKNQARTGGGANWKGGRGGQFGKKRYGLGHQSRDIQHFFCEVCKISCAGQAAYKDHVDGRPHKKREQAVKEEAMHRRIGFRCEVCEVTCSSKDTFDAHVKGQKHQRTIALLRRMGKPVPQIDLDNIGANLTTKAQGKPIPTVGTSGPLKKVVGVTGTKFVGGTTLLTTGEEYKLGGSNAATAVTGVMKPQDLEKALLGDEDVKPVGEEFIEEEKDSLGKFVAYMCKLCDCKFSDINAKNVHLKGRRHRLQYKQKVDPSLKVENKSGWGSRRDGHRRRNQRDDGYYNGHAEFQIMQQPRPILPMPRNQEVMDDKHVLQKLQQIQLNIEEVREVDRLALYAERTLKAVSDSMINSTELTAEQVEQKRVLKGVMRVGLLAQHLLLKTDKTIDLVVLCSKIPSVTLLKKVVELFKKYAELNETEKLTIQEKIGEAAFIITLSTIPFECRVTMTSVVLREGNQPQAPPPQQKEGEVEAKVEEEAPPIDPLPKEACLNALAELRRAKFYQVKCMPLHSMNPTVKAVRDISQRVRTWSPLNNWAIILLVEKTIASISMPLSPGDAVRRIFEVISSGIFLSKRSKLLDPCEKEPVDVLGHITDQEREDITSSAQHALRLIAYNQVYKILGIDRIPDPLPLTENQLSQQLGGESPNAKKGKVEAVEVKEEDIVVSSK